MGPSSIAAAVCAEDVAVFLTNIFPNLEFVYGFGFSTDVSVVNPWDDVGRLVSDMKLKRLEAMDLGKA